MCAALSACCDSAGNVTLFVYGSGDIVSNELKGPLRMWEKAEIDEWLWAIRQWKQQPGAADTPLTVDIGANLGEPHSVGCAIQQVQGRAWNAGARA